MDIHLITQDTYELMVERFQKFSEEIENLCPDQQAINTDWLNCKDVCELLKIGTRTLRDYRDGGHIPFSTIGRKYFYKVSDIEELIQSKSLK